MQNIVTRGKLLEDIEFQAKEINTKAAVKIKPEAEDVQTLNVKLLDLQEQINKIQLSKSNFYKSSSTKAKQCFNCGNAWPHQSQCSAVNKTCHNCGKSNHFARVCRGNNKPTTKIYTRDARPLNYVENNEEDINFQYDSQIFSPHRAIKPHQSYNPGVSPIFTVKETKSKNADTKLEAFQTHIMIEGKSISCLIDTGCSTNIINLATYQYLKRSTKIQLKTTKVSLVTYGATKESTNLKTLGTIRCLVESNNRLAEDVFFVVNTTET